METMDKITKLNTAQLFLSISRVENKFVNNVASVADNLTKVMNDVYLDLKNNSEKFDGIKEMVAALNVTVTGLEDEMTKHKTSIIEYRDKISPN